MSKILLVLIILFPSCLNENNKNQYSVEFYEYFKNSEIELHADSLIFPKDSHIEPVRLPSYLLLNKEYIFNVKTQNQILKVKRINYTDIDFEIEFNNNLTTGRASLSPSFYIGAESIGTSEGEFWISHYYVTKSSVDCLSIIGIGNQNIAKEELINTYAYIYIESGCTTNKVQETKELLWLEN